MAAYITLAERKARKAAALAGAADDLARSLKAYAVQNHGRYWLFGSAARSSMKFTSDVDILIDFAPGNELNAWLFAEEQCQIRHLTPDIHFKSTSSPSFLARIARDARVVP